MGAILNSGHSKFAQHQGLEQPLVINRFVFALIDGLDTGADVDLNETMPTPSEIVHEEPVPVNGKGYLSPDKVVYSVLLGPAVGDFYFNWIGLVSADNTLMAVSYTPTQYKYKTVGLNIGNTLTRNFLLHYTNAQAITGIDIPVEAWQVDFMGRFESIEERNRLDMQTVFGDSYFINDGFLATTNGSNITLKAGTGYVNGLRVSLQADRVVDVGVPPKDVYLDVQQEGDVSGSSVVADVVTSPLNVPLSSYQDENGTHHFLVKVASVNAALAVTDLRKKIAINSSLIEALLNRNNHTGTQAISTVAGLQTALDSKLASNHASVTNSREWTAATVSQADAEAGESTARTAWTAQRVRQAILGWWNNSGLSAQLLNRMNHTGTQAISTVAGLQTALDNKLASSHASVTNSREWTAATVSQADAEAGTSTARTAWTAQRVRQAILGWWNNSTFKTKLDGIATGATANATDAQLRDRSTHTGTQAINTVSGLQAALDSKLASNHASVTNAREWTAATISQVDAEAGTSTTRTAWTAQRVRQAILAWWNNSAFKTKLDGIAAGATANATDAQLRARSTHTGTQAIGTIDGLQNALNGKQNSLGFSPVQQGTGIGQLPNTVKIGWSGSKLRATVDSTDLGNMALESYVVREDDRLWNECDNIWQAVDAFYAKLFQNHLRRSLTVTPYDVLNSGTFYYWVMDKMAFFSIQLNCDRGTNSEQVCVIPSGHRPQWETSIPIFMNGGQYGDTWVNITVQTNGIVQAVISLENYGGSGTVTISGVGMWRIA